MIVNGKWRFPCPCCGYYTMEGEASGTYDICEVCGWEDDNLQLQDPNYRGGANRNSLNEARDLISNGTLNRERAPRPEEYPPGDERLWEYRTIDIPLRGPAFERVVIGSDEWRRMHAAADCVIVPEVEGLLAEGWERTHPTGYEYLADHERVDAVMHHNGWDSKPAVATYNAVRVQLRRPKQEDGEMP